MQENHLERSARLFSLAEENSIPTTPGALEPLDDNTFLKFREEYHHWSQQRDNALLKYLFNSTNKFRVYLPYTDRVFNLASQIVWYFDEIIVRDPIPIVLDRNDENLEEEKIRIRELIQQLSCFRGPIENGYVLFIGKSVLDQFTTPNSELAEKISKIPKVIGFLEEATYCGYEKRPDSQGNLTDIYQLALDSGGLFGIQHGSIHGNVHFPGIRIGDYLPRIEPSELQKVIGKSPFDLMQEIFKTEIERAILSATQAYGLGSAVLFDREVDSQILINSGSVLDSKLQISTVGLLNLLVPYIKDLPSDRLAELREKMPSAFIDFRGNLLHVVTEAINKGETTQEQLQGRIEQQLLPSLRQLESEQKAARIKFKWEGIGMPTAIAAIAKLACTYWAVPPAALLASGVAGAAAVVKAIAEVQSASAKAEGHPFYFLWKAMP